jgi:hypothetical protein
MAKKEDIVQQMIDTIGELPAEWQRSWSLMPKRGEYPRVLSRYCFVHTALLTLLEPVDEKKYNLEQLLQELYFDQDRVADFSQQDITRLAMLIVKLLRYRASTRSTAAEILSENWFSNV